MKSFVLRINQEFTKSLPGTSKQKDSENEDDTDIELLLNENRADSNETNLQLPEEQEPIQPAPVAPKVFKHSEKTVEKPPPITPIKKKPCVKIEKVTEAKAILDTETEAKDYMDVESSELFKPVVKTPEELYTEEEQLDEDGNMFGEEIYDIMEIEGADNIYLDETGKQVLADEDGEFILVNFKSSNEDLTEKEQQFVVEELYDDEAPDTKQPTTRKKHVTRMPREIIDKYAQSTENNQHICTKCVKVFSTRTNLIRHIQSHDGYKAYVCQICDKGFTQSGSLKQHMYIHSGERPYKCEICNRAFTQGKTLKFHLRRHTEEKPFICSECNSAFRQRDGLKRHLRSRHSIELKYDRNNHMSDKIVYVSIDQDTGNNTDTKSNASTDTASGSKKD